MSRFIYENENTLWDKYKCTQTKRIGKNIKK